MHFKNKMVAFTNTGLLLLICKQSQLASVGMGQSSWISSFNSELVPSADSHERASWITGHMYVQVSVTPSSRPQCHSFEI